MMDSLLQGIAGVYDVLITSSSVEEHLLALGQAGLRLNQSKCIFMASSVEYLGYMIDKPGLHPTQEKVMYRELIVPHQ